MTDPVYLFTKQQIFGLVKIENICRPQNRLNFKTKFLFGIGKKILWQKEKNAGYQHFLLFPQSFQKASFFRVVESGDCVVKGYTRP